MRHLVVAALVLIAPVACVEQTDDSTSPEALGVTSAAAAAVTPDDDEDVDPDWVGTRWTDGQIAYVIDKNGDFPKPSRCVSTGDVGGKAPKLTTAQVDAIEAAIAELDTLLAPHVRFTRFMPDDPPPVGRSYLIYRADPPKGKASSTVIRGMPRGDTDANCVFVQKTSKGAPLQNDVEGRRLMLHETGHALGLWHEQQRMDRDFYISVDGTCLANKSQAARDKLYNVGDETNQVLLSPYDTESIMQYGSTNGCFSSTVAGCVDAGPPKVCNFPPFLKRVTCEPAASTPPSSDDCNWIPVPNQLSVHDVNVLIRMYTRPLSDATHAGDAFGREMVSGDFDNDGYPDLAVGAPGYAGGGAVFLYRTAGGDVPGSIAGKLIPWRLLRPADFPSGYSHHGFGATLLAADQNGDGKTDLLVGAPRTNAAGHGAGTVFIYVSAKVTNSPRRTIVPGAVLTPDYVLGSAGLDGDGFGAAIAVGDFDDDDEPDVAIGAPQTRAGGVRAGAVGIAYGDGHRDKLTSQNTWSEPNRAGARFGAALAAGRINGRRGDDLVIGSPSDVTAGARPGAVYVLYDDGGMFGYVQTLAPIGGSAGTRIHFGESLALGDFHGDDLELAVGAPHLPQSGPEGAIAGVGGVYLFANAGSGPTPLAPLAVYSGTRIAADEHFGAVLHAFRSPLDDGDVLAVGVPDARNGAGRAELMSWIGGGGVTAQQTEVPTPPQLQPGDHFARAIARMNLLPEGGADNAYADFLMSAPGRNDDAGVFFAFDGPLTTELPRWAGPFDETEGAPE